MCVFPKGKNNSVRKTGIWLFGILIEPLCLELTQTEKAMFDKTLLYKNSDYFFYCSPLSVLSVLVKLATVYLSKENYKIDS